MTNATTGQTDVVLFLRNEQDRSLLREGALLYGVTSPSGEAAFLTPYRPPSGVFPAVAIVGESASPEGAEGLRFTVSVDGESVIAAGMIDKQYRKTPVKIVSMTAIYARTPFAAVEMDRLWASHVIVFGCGTGGSKIALELARAGVGNITLCDPDLMEFANVSRHEGDLLDVGKPKTQVVAERVYRINPAIHVKTYTENIFDRAWDEIASILPCDLVVAATDRTAIQMQINEITRRMKLPCVFGGCYEEALGGEVFYTLPDEIMPCLACLRGGLKQPIRNPEIDYSTARSTEDYQGQPGLHAAVDFVTCVEIQICLALLLRGVGTSRLRSLIDPRFNFLLVGGALGAGFYRFRKPFDIFFQPLKGPRKNCPVCGNGLRSLIPQDNGEEPGESPGATAIGGND
jgi:molybdopterin/thiamine biosynthesis adenylyltransferase